MNLFRAMVLLWILSVPLSYLLLRWDHRAHVGKWRCIDRICALGLSVVNGPLTLLIGGGAALFNKINASGWANREASW